MTVQALLLMQVLLMMERSMYPTTLGKWVPVPTTRRQIPS